MERVLDHIVQFDERSRQFPIMAIVDRTEPRPYTWACSVCLDQGREGACVGHAFAHEAAARPVVREADSDLAFRLYYRAQDLDGMPWTEGTSIIAGAKAAREAGYLNEFRWGFGLKDCLAGVSRKGPAVLGLNWYEGMFDPDKNGMLHVSGDIAGGHAILMTGVSVKNRTVTLHNSWGSDWGVNGKAKLSWDDLDRLLDEDGECCIPVIR